MRSETEWMTHQRYLFNIPVDEVFSVDLLCVLLVKVFFRALIWSVISTYSLTFTMLRQKLLILLPRIERCCNFSYLLNAYFTNINFFFTFQAPSPLVRVDTNKEYTQSETYLIFPRPIQILWLVQSKQIMKIG